MQTIQELIAAKDIIGIKAYMVQHDLIVRDGKIVPKDSEAIKALKKLEEFWNSRQQTRKILLNALYGALLNAALRFHDERMGQSTTLTGRSIVKHMNAKINEIVTQLYDYVGESIQYADTDSVAKESMIHTSLGHMTIEDFFNRCETKWIDGDKEYAGDKELSVLIGTSPHSSPHFSSFNYVYRHKTSKRRFKITTKSGRTVIVTEDHSVMQYSDAGLVEQKPTDLKINDMVLINTLTPSIGVCNEEDKIL